MSDPHTSTQQESWSLQGRKNVKVMDVALLPNGKAKIVEFNSVHSSGFYAIGGVDFANIADDVVRSAFPRPGRGTGPR